MPELKAYDVEINGAETTLLLDADEAADRGFGEKDLRSTRQAAFDAAAEKKAAAARSKAARADAARVEPEPAGVPVTAPGKSS